MATLSILPLPPHPFDMTSKRAPLANVPNAVNSPFRPVSAGNGKRTRAQAGELREVEEGQPPAKKQILDLSDDDAENVDPRRRNGVPVYALERAEEPFAKRTANAPPTVFEKKLNAVRERRPPPPQRNDQPQKQAGDNLESIRQWKRHYKRQFPGFVFYFESVPQDIRLKAARQLQLLGAREEKFFSNAVTHVVTTRSIPPELVATSPDDDPKYDAAQTVQPAALTQDQRKTTDLLDANLQRRAQTQSNPVFHDADARRPHAQRADILTRARELGIKIWALEKMQRVLKTMFEIETDDQPDHHDPRAAVLPAKSAPKPSKDADLEQLLRHEKINGPADRDMTVSAQDMTVLKGYFLYIHDMDEKTRPVLVRDYPKVASKEQGTWPQFRLTPIGRCPFVDDPAHTKKLQQQEREAQAAATAEQELASQRKTRAAATYQPLTERDSNLRRSPRKVAAQGKVELELSKPLDPPKNIPPKRQSSAGTMPNIFGSFQQNARGLPRMIGGEPVASGLQPSNVTSAIRSQAISSTAISSTAAGVNRRVGDSKEVSALKRKVLTERGASVTSTHSMPSSYMNDVRAAINDDINPPPRAAKRRAQETLGVLHEDDEDHGETVGPTHRRPAAPRKRKPAQKEPKPGYCENCREKFDDFDDHTLSRKHKKFALAPENWKELDALLVQLKRPHKSL